jgi:hypothetical protein
MLLDFSFVHREHGDIDTINAYFGSGNSFSAGCGRISYVFLLAVYFNLSVSLPSSLTGTYLTFMVRV